MSEHSSKNKVKLPRLACYVRFTPEEFQRLQEDERVTGRNIQKLLKKAYFEREPTVLLMKDEDAKHFSAQILRIGNNVNQIARQLNSGFAYGFQNELETIRSQLTLLLSWVTSKYRAHRPEK